jgi:hypothetical protein
MSDLVLAITAVFCVALRGARFGIAQGLSRNQIVQMTIFFTALFAAIDLPVLFG